MTGIEFEQAVKAAGYTQKRFAEIMGVYRTTIANQYQSLEVEPFWVYALAGLIAAKSTKEITDIVSKANKILDKK